MVVFLIAILWIAITSMTYFRDSQQRFLDIDQAVKLANMGLAQKNRTLVEGIVSTTSSQIGAETVAVCAGGSVIASTGKMISTCRLQPSLSYQVIDRPIPGFSGYTMLVVLSRFSLVGKGSIFLIFGVVFVGFCFALVYRVQKQIAKDIIDPLRHGFMAKGPMPIEELEKIRKYVQETQASQTSQAVSKAIVERNMQVAHDIRSPLSALNMVLETVNSLPENKRLLIRNATQRINDIANTLIRSQSQKGSVVDSELEDTMLGPLIDTLMTEKRMQFRGRMEVEIIGDLSKSYGLFARISIVELSRVISNLVNNSVEAISEAGRVTVGIRDFQDQIGILIVDTGKGIPPEVLNRLGESRLSFGKDVKSGSGSGFGLFHARGTMQKLGGALSIESRLGRGTIVTLTLPKMKAPPWFVSKIEIPADTTIVSVDDDKSIHQVWAGRLSNFKHIMFSSIDQFEKWLVADDTKSRLFLVDHDFGNQSRDGLEAIERLGILSQSILVTSRYEDIRIRDYAVRLGVKILPKAFVPLVPLGGPDSIGKTPGAISRVHVL